MVSLSKNSFDAVHGYLGGVQGSCIAAGFHYLGPPHRCGGVPMFDTEERLSSKGAIATIAIARITQIKLPGGNQEHPPSDDEEQGQASQATTSRNVATSSSRGPKMHAQQQQYWTYAKQRDFALKKSLHKNFTKPIFPFPAFPERVLEPSVAEENSEDAEEDNEDD
ncbi:hypothetical protein TIFTF001_042743 [Ficus carica]|uniref:Uncharacterized protein n=1 Tax=Ficus carica TaxID=3494 RepID=A0AA88D0Q7_FICCA|nr:hypothetical protein TIFTF001_042735 [Ficus carica]GMN38021.1 hypothetical protein TIFTF001_042737 [Ficus carica]GMN38030.1 hypothetical protein TIFTF001_042741 [Ficus carica]GMN38047.1 hypothetical protein TIFTF001_042743 [Ficus carica]